MRKEGDLLAPRQEQSGMGTKMTHFFFFALRIQWTDPFPVKIMAKAPLTPREASLRCAVPFCQVKSVI